MARIGKKEAAIAEIDKRIDPARDEWLAQSDRNTPERNAQLRQTIDEGRKEQLRIAGVKRTP